MIDCKVLDPLHSEVVLEENEELVSHIIDIQGDSELEVSETNWFLEYANWNMLNVNGQRDSKWTRFQMIDFKIMEMLDDGMSN